VKNADYKIFESKDRTYYAIVLGLTRIKESIMRYENAVLTVSSLLQDYYGVSDLCLSVPTIINREGVREVLKLSSEKKAFKQFQNSATILRDILQSLDLK
jgi:L-lactate dehydrogenase